MSNSRSKTPLNLKKPATISQSPSSLYFMRETRVTSEDPERTKEIQQVYQISLDTGAVEEVYSVEITRNSPKIFPR
jgi:hypothetical protein